METPRELLTRIASEAADRECSSLDEMMGPGLSHNISRARAEFFVRAYVEGFSVTLLARFLNKDRQSVRQALQTAGLTLRKQQRQPRYTGVPYRVD